MIRFNPLATVPPVVFLTEIEDVEFGCDMTKFIQSPQTVTNPSVTMTDNRGNVIALTQAPSVSGNIIQQFVEGSLLTTDISYGMWFSFTPGGTSQEVGCLLTVTVAPYGLVG